MTAAGVQTNDSSAYLPPPSTSTPNAKGTGGAGKPSTDAPAANASGAPSNFRSELDAQQSGTQQTGKRGPESAGSAKTDPAKRGSAKLGKKRDARTDDVNSSTVTPAPVAEPQKPIPPFALALAPLQEPMQPQENAKLDDNAKAGENAAPNEYANSKEIAQQPVQSAGQVPVSSIAAGTQLAELLEAAAPAQPSAPATNQSAAMGQATVTKQSAVTKQPAITKQSAKRRQSATSGETLPIPGASVASSGTPDSSKAWPLAAGLPMAQAVPMQDAATNPADPSSGDNAHDRAQNRIQDQATTSAKPGASLESQPVSPMDVRLPAAPTEPVTSGVQGTVDSTPSSPSALAFAARMTVASQKASQPVAANAIQIAAVSGSQTPDQIPMRYGATAQIIQSAALGNKPGTQEGGPKKDAGLSIDKFARPDVRTDMVLPRFEASSEPAPSSGSAAPLQAAPPVRSEVIMEPPAAPPTSSRDIRVRVPDNNGGSTQVRFVESRGEVRVSVRTADDGLAQNLRTHLNDLTQRLSDGGMPAEIWKPAPTAASSQNDQQQSHQDGRGSGGQGSGGQGGQQDRQRQRPAWLDEMEASLHGEQG